ncbi:DUF3024 domain-containing protein [Wenyingzhuangia sp. IMCC45467]
MKVIDFTEIQIREYIEEIRPPREIRKEVDLSYSYENNVVEIFEIRPKWDDIKVIENFPIARVKHVKSKNIWRIYWMDSNQKWIQYKPNFEEQHFSKVIEIIKKDEHGCFWG